MAVQKGDIGTIIRFTTETDISAASTLTLKYQKPDDTTGAWDATVHSTYSAQFTTTLSTHLDQAGKWLLQVYAELASWEGHSEIEEFYVKDNIS